MTDNNAPHHVYRLFDGTGALLYVGVSKNLPSRFKDHERGSEWFKEISTTASIEYPTRAKALEVESVAIATEKPRHNRMWVRPGPPLSRKPRKTIIPPFRELTIAISDHQYRVIKSGAARAGIRRQEYCRRLLDEAIEHRAANEPIGHPEDWGC